MFICVSVLRTVEYHTVYTDVTKTVTINILFLFNIKGAHYIDTKNLRYYVKKSVSNVLFNCLSVDWVEYHHSSLVKALGL